MLRPHKLRRMDTGRRWQYVVANVGMFDASVRLPRVLAHMGANGYELITVYDKSSNWFANMEKGFMLFKREVLAGEEPTGPWCGVLDPTTMTMKEAEPLDTNHGYPAGQAW